MVWSGDFCAELCTEVIWQPLKADPTQPRPSVQPFNTSPTSPPTAATTRQQVVQLFQFPIPKSLINDENNPAGFLYNLAIEGLKIILQDLTDYGNGARCMYEFC